MNNIFTREALREILEDEQTESDIDMSKEISESWYCYMYGPCRRCVERKKDE